MIKILGRLCVKAIVVEKRYCHNAQCNVAYNIGGCPLQKAVQTNQPCCGMKNNKKFADQPQGRCMC